MERTRGRDDWCFISTKGYRPIYGTGFLWRCHAYITDKHSLNAKRSCRAIPELEMITVHQYSLTFIYNNNSYSEQLELKSDTCVLYWKQRWTRVRQTCLFWEWGLICRELDYWMTWTEAEIECQMRCMWYLVFFKLTQKRHTTHPPVHFFFFLTIILAVISLFDVLLLCRSSSSQTGSRARV